MNNQVDPIIKTNQDNFLNYNNHIFSIDLLSKLIDSDTFQQLSPANRLLIDTFQQLSPESKLFILRKFKDMLLSKTFIDEILFNRQAENVKNQSLLKKLARQFRSLPDTEADLQQIHAKIKRKEYLLTDNSDIQLVHEASPVEQTNQLKSQISYVNGHRLDGVWSRNFANIMINYNQIQLPVFSDVNVQVNNLNGLTSYGFYVVRGGMETAKLIKHSFSDHEHYTKNGLKPLDKFKVQWDLRSPVIINDILLWAPVNAVTFHFWLDMKGNILTAILLLGDLIHSLYNYHICNQRFAYLKAELEQCESDDMLAFINLLEEQHRVNLSKQKYFLTYQFLLLSAFSTLCGFFLNLDSATQTNFAIVGGLVCFSIQFFVNLIDFIFEMKAAENDQQVQAIYLKMASRILIQASIPALFLSTSYLLPILGLNLPTAFVTLSLFAMSACMVRLSNDLSMLFDTWKLSNDPQAGETRRIALGQQIRSMIENSQDKNQINLKIDEWITSYQQDKGLELSSETAIKRIQQDLVYGLSLLSFISSAALILTSAMPLAPIIAGLIGASSYVAANQIKQPQIDERAMTDVLKLQLGMP